MRTLQLLGEVDVGAEIRALRATPGGRAGTAHVTVVRYRDFRVDLITLAAGLRIGPHANPGVVSVECVAGPIRMHVDERDYDLPAGEALALGRGVARHVEALHDSDFLVTIGRPVRMCRRCFRVAGGYCRQNKRLRSSSWIVEVTTVRTRREIDISKRGAHQDAVRL